MHCTEKFGSICMLIQYSVLIKVQTAVCIYLRSVSSILSWMLI